MSFKNKFLIFFILLITLFFTFYEIYHYYLEVNETKHESYSKNQTVFNNIMKMQSDTIKTLALALSNDTLIKKGYLENNPEIIKQHINPFWKKVQEDKLVHEIHFFKPPAESFVNFSNFASIGQDTSDVRTDIQWVTSSFKNSTHVMMCKTYAGIRATYPIVDNNGTMLGGLSMGKKIDWLPQTMKDIIHNEVFLLYSKEATTSLMEKYYKDFIKDKQIIGNYVLGEQTMQIPQDIIKKIDFSKQTQLIKINEITYTLDIFTINGFNGKLLTYVCVLNNLSDLNNRFIDETIEHFLLILLIAFVIYFILQKRINGILNKITSMQKITHQIKNNQFNILYEKQPSANSFSNELNILEQDIYQMGYALEKSYSQLTEQLEDEVKKLNKAQTIAKLGSYEYFVKENSLSCSNKLLTILNLEQTPMPHTLQTLLETITNEEDKKLVQTNIASIINGEKTITSFIFHTHIKGVELILSSTLEVGRYDKDNKLSTINGTIQDITEQENLRIENKKNSEMLAQQSKMVAMGEMLENIAHQWRQPLSVISTTISSIQVKKSLNLLDDKFLDNSLNQALISTQHLNDTVIDFRDFFKDSKQKHLFFIDESIEKTIFLLSSRFINKNIKIIKNIPKIQLEGFNNELIQVFMNIFNNAIDQLKNQDTNKVVFIDAYTSNNNLTIEIKDNAGGIEPNILHDVFEAHFTTKDEYYGTGIGLYMSKKIIQESFKGNITVSNVAVTYNNEKYKGANFIINIPLT